MAKRFTLVLAIGLTSLTLLREYSSLSRDLSPAATAAAAVALISTPESDAYAASLSSVLATHSELTPPRRPPDGQQHERLWQRSVSANGPAGAKPAAHCVPLDAAAVRAASTSNDLGVTFVTFANHAQLDFALNWHAHLAALQLGSSSLVGATDAPTERGLAAAGVRCYPLRSALGEAEAKWGSEGFSHMGRTKARLLRTLLELNATVLFADADVVFLRDPLPFIRRQLDAGAQLLFHTDGFGSSARALAAQPEGLEEPSFGLTPELNTGLFVAHPAARKLAIAWCDALDADGAFSNWKNDQQSLNQLVRRGLRIRPGSALMGAFDGTLELGLLPNHLFPSGHVFFLQRALRAAHAPPYAVHLTFQNCDQSGKRHRMREAGLWLLDPPEHYEPEGGLLSYEPDLPAELTTAPSLLSGHAFAPLERNMRVPDPECMLIASLIERNMRVPDPLRLRP